MLIGQDVPKRLVEASMQTKFINSTNFQRMSEDVIWPGIVAELAGIARINNHGFSIDSDRKYHCFTDKKEQVVIAVHYIKGIEDTNNALRDMKQTKIC